MSKTDGVEPFHVEEGTAKDQEAIVRLRSSVEEHVSSEVGKFSNTYLEWNMNKDATFWYKIYFYA